MDIESSHIMRLMRVLDPLPQSNIFSRRLGGQCQQIEYVSGTGGFTDLKLKTAAELKRFMVNF